MEGIIPTETSKEDFRNFLAVDATLQRNPKKPHKMEVQHWHNQQKAHSLIKARSSIISLQCNLRILLHGYTDPSVFYYIEA